MRINLLADNYIEPWDYRNVFDVGIGGSETSQVEMAIRLAARGHDVTSFGPLPKDCPDREFRGVHWRHCFDDGGETDCDLFIVYRNPCALRNRPLLSRTKTWLVCQDVFYPHWQSKIVGQFDRILALCPRHFDDIVHRDPDNVSQVYLSGNGVNVERIEQAEIDSPRRNPKRLIWTSSPDRGLKECLDIFEQAREQVPDLELKIFYGLDNIEKISGGDATKPMWRESYKQRDRAKAMPGVGWVGRVGQQQLTREWLSAGIWLYPSWFQETSCVSCMEAQACGAIPIFNPIWGCAHNCKHGIFVEGDPNEPLVKARYVDAVVSVAMNPRGQEQMRQSTSTSIGMMEESRRRLSWETVASQWEGWMKAANQDLRWNDGKLTSVQELAGCC